MGAITRLLILHIKDIEFAPNSARELILRITSAVRRIIATHSVDIDIG